MEGRESRECALDRERAADDVLWRPGCSTVDARQRGVPSERALSLSPGMLLMVTFIVNRVESLPRAFYPATKRGMPEAAIATGCEPVYVMRSPVVGGHAL